ncbi:hypothetical protein KGF57_004224 [Candida theae]|uniref:Signal recognition particle receptor subunit beta n=1 Tax=Candida theae TaxID=1198502 RepID=A0AAD5BC42_9ASCO|nr:uncharacterized protein KGF57_004224 [Candida theae]KAI5952095.1 hypothetical protein KGF57_004224 [Candida theae]
MDKVLLILLSILIGFILLLIQFFLQSGGLNAIKFSSKNKSPYYKPSFIICGPNNSGKTALFYRLATAESSEQQQQQEDDEGEEEQDQKKGRAKITTTVSSIEPNFGTVTLPITTPSISKPFQLVDYPGHLKYWNLFTKLIKNDITLSNIKGIVVVIDSSSANWTKGSTNANTKSGSGSTSATSSAGAEVEKLTKFLYNLLAITERKQNGIDFLFAVNKSDLFDSVPTHKIRSTLEVEIDKLIHNEINNVDKTSGIDAIGEDVDEGANDGSNGGEYGSGSGSGAGSGAGAGGYRENMREFWLSIIGSSEGQFTFDKLEGNMDFLSGSVLKNKIDKWESWFDEKVVNS